MSRFRFLRSTSGKVGTAICLFVVLVAVFGPFVSPYGPAELVGAPGQPPGGDFLLGTDSLGRDVLSRVLWGGRSVLSASIIATALAFGIGITIGLIAGYSRSIIDPILMRGIDVILVFPPVLFFLVAVTAVGNTSLVVVLSVAIVLAPRVARLVYTATKEVSVRGYVEAAVARGETTASILRREILPSISGPVIANLGLTLTFAILIIAAVNFLGFGAQPPAANWALMISENRQVQALNIWSTVVPALMIATLTIGLNLVGDAISHALGRSEVDVGGTIGPVTERELT